MTEDVSARADDYERRLANAGSTEDIIGGLVKGADRNRKTVRLLTVTLIVDFVLSFFMAGIALTAWNNADNIQTNTDRLRGIVYEQCMDVQKSAKGINTVLSTLIENAAVSTIFSPAEKSSRMKNYEKARVTIQDCD